VIGHGRGGHAGEVEDHAAVVAGPDLARRQRPVHQPDPVRAANGAQQTQGQRGGALGRQGARGQALGQRGRGLDRHHQQPALGPELGVEHRPHLEGAGGPQQGRALLQLGATLGAQRRHAQRVE
jgi:hypothetical protein